MLTKFDILSNETQTAFPMSIDDRKASNNKVSDRHHSGDRKSSIGSESHTLKKSNRYLALKLHKEFMETAGKLDLDEFITRKDLFNLYVNLGYFRIPESI